MGRDLRCEIGDLLLGGGDGVGTGDEAARRRLLAGDRDQRPGELRRVASLPAVLGTRRCGTWRGCARRWGRPRARCGRRIGWPFLRPVGSAGAAGSSIER
jgi:hypothetical protein